MKTAFITGITGQDGSYLAELLLKKNYKVIGLVSKKHGIGNQNIKQFKDKLILEEGDLLDKTSLEKIIKKHSPNEIYNLGAVSFVPSSWEKPSFVFNVNALGSARILELIKDVCPKTKFFQATSAKIFGNPLESPQNEKTSVSPATPYATSKAAAHFLTKNFRDHFNIFACSAIMYNHESERRGEQFVSRKITSGAVKIKLGLKKSLKLGNIEAEVDWGYAPDYVFAIWKMLQQSEADDYILASGKQHKVKDILQIAFSHLDLEWKKLVEYDETLARKEQEKKFYGDISKTKKKLNWEPKVGFKKMIIKMVEYDLRRFS